ncbi:MAG: hypothetical protein Q9160_007435 [Pyrenula sp. 1 TL-2023]
MASVADEKTERHDQASWDDDPVDRKGSWEKDVERAGESAVTDPEERPQEARAVTTSAPDNDPRTDDARRTLVKVRRSERRGLFGRFTLLAEVEEPKHYSRTTKWFITFVIAVAAAAAPLGSAILYPNSIGMFVALRMLGGGASASVQAVGAGTIADIWDTKERGRAMLEIDDVVAGHLWRNKKRKLVTADMYDPDGRTAMPGARKPLTRVASTRSVQQASRKWAKISKMILVDPFKIILYLRFPPVLLTVYWASLTFGSLYVLNISIQDTFHKAPYSYSDLIVGLLYIPGSVGYVVSSVFGGRWLDTIMRREAEKRRTEKEAPLVYRPEDRMRENAWLGTLVYSGALIWYGWTAENGVIWPVPAIASFFFGCGSMLIFSMATTMLTEFMPRKSSSGVAVNNFVRNIFSCVGGIVAAPIIGAIGNGWIFTILGLWALSSCSIIWAMRRYGQRWRTTMDAKLD